MVIVRGDIFWADLGPAEGSRPAKRRPVLVIQADEYNASRIATVIVAIVTSNLALADWPGNVFLSAAASGLPRDSVVNTTQIATLNKTDLREPAGHVPSDVMRRVDDGLNRVLAPSI